MSEHEYTNAEVVAHLKRIRSLLLLIEPQSTVPADTRKFLDTTIAVGEFEVKNDAMIESLTKPCAAGDD